MTAGWHHAIEPTPWDQLDERFADLAAVHPEFDHMSRIVRSVLSCGADRDLAAFTSMHDLMVVNRPIAEPPVDIVAVRAPSSGTPVPGGQVIIEHLSTTGHGDRIERPTGDAVPLFWRFMLEKFGVDPSVAGTDAHQPDDRR